MIYDKESIMGKTTQRKTTTLPIQKNLHNGNQKSQQTII